ncbi:MAG: hypothetical protein JSV26_01780 [bacterium]|nr:MAG: hypothetical protein JSV26_01780 [bacterium]
MISGIRTRFVFLSLAAAVFLSACGGEEEKGRLTVGLSLPPGWQDRLDMGVLSAQGSTPYIGTVRIRITCGGVESSWEAPWATRSLSLDGLDLKGGCDILAQAVTAGAVIMERQLIDVRVGDGADVPLDIQLEESEGFSAAGSLINPRQYHSATPLPGGVLIVGGTLDTGAIESISATGRALAASAYGCSLVTPRTRQRVLHDDANGQLFVFLGGMDDSQYEIISTDDGQCYGYSIEGNRKNFFPAIYKQSVFLFGGYDVINEWIINTLEINSNSLSENTVFTMGIPSPRQNLHCLVSGVYLSCLGGMDGSNYLAEVSVMDLENEVNRTQRSLSKPKTSFGMTSLSDGRFLLTGGINGSGFLKDVEIFDPNNGQVIDFGEALIYPRTRHSATLLLNDTVLVVGGLEYTGPSISAEIFDPATGISRELPWRMRVPRVGHTATLLPDGRVLIVGGNMGDKTIEVFNPRID